MFILYLALIVIVAKLAGALSVRFHQPAVLGEIIAGVLLGPSVLGFIEPSDLLSAFSTIGVILLMFIAGLETDISEFKRSAKSAAFVGFGGIIIPLLVGYFIGGIMELTNLQSWFLGVMLSATSVSISVQALKEMNYLKTREGTTILGAAVLDDIVVMIILVFLMSFAGGEEISLTMLVINKLLFFIFAILIGWKVIPWLMDRLTKLPVSETVISSALIICLAYAFAAEYMGVASIIGAYIAGIAIGSTKFNHIVLKKVETISYSLFVPIFFAYIGISAEFTGVFTNFGLIILLSVLAIFSKFIGAGAGAKCSGFGWKSSMGIGSAMVSRGEVALIVGSLGLTSNLITQDLYASLIVVVIITTLITPLLMKLFFSSSLEHEFQNNFLRK
ncbi:monovalent cation:proton antiporter-2 (CPA2) family protein [Sporosarcina luteola]|nr:monovalent cation:proton antiporter-2 (CPA2) family protein [Sporosarcina luteola]